jgi:hypothetical protein
MVYQDSAWSSAVGDSLAEAVNAWERNDYAKVSASCKKIPIGSAYYWRAPRIIETYKAVRSTSNCLKVSLL